MARKIHSAMAMLALAAACSSEPAPPTLSAAARLGRVYHVDLYIPPPDDHPTSTPDGSFSTIMTSSSGNRVGRVNGRFSYWPSGAGSPTYMFPADTNESGIGPIRINDRGEVVFYPTALGQIRPVWIWRDGVLKNVVAASSGCIRFLDFSNRGVLIKDTGCAGPATYFREPSPFPPADTARSGRFAGQKCNLDQGQRGISSTSPYEFRMINNQNDILARRGSVLYWESTGCRSVDSWVIIIGDAGLAGGSQTVGGFPTALVTDAVVTATLDELLDAESQVAWHISSVVAMPADSSIIATATRLSDNTTATVRLTLKKP